MGLNRDIIPDEYTIRQSKEELNIHLQGRNLMFYTLNYWTNDPEEILTPDLPVKNRLLWTD